MKRFRTGCPFVSPGESEVTLALRPKAMILIATRRHGTARQGFWSRSRSGHCLADSENDHPSRRYVVSECEVPHHRHYKSAWIGSAAESAFVRPPSSASLSNGDALIQRFARESKYILRNLLPRVRLRLPDTPVERLRLVPENIDRFPTGADELHSEGICFVERRRRHRRTRPA